jgi:O-acetylhomoserine/O-acetylserine sulfhydrylase-like pyridoxal-dependent enzyme
MRMAGQIETIEATTRALDARIALLETGQALLNLKSGIWGAVAGVIVVISAILMKLFFSA